METLLPRVIALWIPDWPVHAHLRETAESTQNNAQGSAAAPVSAQIALLSRQRVIACSAEARAAGVRIGLREREAQSRCPQLTLQAHVPEVDERHFAPVLAAIEQLIPEVEPLRPGLCVMRARGPARYFGDEARAAAALQSLMQQTGFSSAHVGIAAGKFAAEQAARSPQDTPTIDTPTDRVHIVAQESTTAFLGSLPVDRACSPDFGAVLHGLGIHTLGALAALPETAVHERFGQQGIAAYRRATAQRAAHTNATSEVAPRTPPADLMRSIDFEPPVTGADELTFACSATVDEFAHALIRERLVCTELCVELTDDTGVRYERTWAHPRQFTSGDVLNRLRWQTSALPEALGRGGAGISRVRLTPTRTDRAAAHEPGLWSSEPDARVHHHLQRVQSLVGHEGVATAELTGGRLSFERYRLTPWGTQPARAASRQRSRSSDGPWPGRPLAPFPSTVFSPPAAAKLLSPTGKTVLIDDADLLLPAPTVLQVAQHSIHASVSAWSQPWPLRERWWALTPTRFRLQVLLSDGDAWLLLHERGRWFAEGHYD